MRSKILSILNIFHILGSIFRFGISKSLYLVHAARTMLHFFESIYHHMRRAINDSYDMVMTLPFCQGINGSLLLINGPYCIRYGPYHNIGISTWFALCTFKRTKRIFLSSCKLQLNLFCKCLSNPRDIYTLVRTPYHYELYG